MTFQNIKKNKRSLFYATILGMKYDYLIVGAGLSGLTLARLLTNAGKKVLLLEKRDHLGGNIATSVKDDIIVHDYGPHIFHTSDEFAWKFFNEYSEVYPFINSPIASYHGERYHLPFNMNTFHELWGINTPEEAKKIIGDEIAKEHISEPKNLEEQALSMVGRTVYTKLIKEYTEKQWGRECKDLPASIIKRLPLRFEYNNNYFNDIYQGLPKGGFSVFAMNLAKGIDIVFNVDFLEEKEKYKDIAPAIIYTGQLDSFFGYKYGKLEWRSLRFEVEELPVDDYQGNPVVNYTSKDVGYTRISEHKHFDPYCKNHHSTIISKEYPDSYSDGKIPYYTVNDERNNSLAKQYLDEAKKLEPNVYFLGRLALYRYFDMDDAIVAANELFLKLMAAE